MADTKLSALTAIAGQQLADGDLSLAVDISDTTMAASGTDKKMTLGDIAYYVANLMSLPPTGAIAQTLNRTAGVLIANQPAALTSGVLRMVAVWLPANTTITSISFYSGTTAAVTPTHWEFGLFDSSRNLLRATADQTTGTIAASTVKTVNLTSTFTTTYTGLHYLGIVVVAGTMPTLMGFASSTIATTVPPITSGTSTTGLTTAVMPNPAAAITPTTIVPWAWCS